jgi:hypothetical protein
MRRESCRLAVLALLLALALPTSGSQAGAKKKRCYEDWSQAQAVVQKNKLAHVDKLSRAALQSGLGHIMKVRLCKGKRGYEYRLILRDRLGRLRRWVTGARRPFPNRKRKRRLRRKH